MEEWSLCSYLIKPENVAQVASVITKCIIIIIIINPSNQSSSCLSGFHVPTEVSLGVVTAVLGIGVALSLKDQSKED